MNRTAAWQGPTQGKWPQLGWREERNKNDLKLDRIGIKNNHNSLIEDMQVILAYAASHPLQGKNEWFCNCILGQRAVCMVLSHWAKSGDVFEGRRSRTKEEVERQVNLLADGDGTGMELKEAVEETEALGP